MKRIANSVAVATLLYTIPADKIVKIVDVDHYMYAASEPWENVDESYGLAYTVDEILHNYENIKIAKAAIRRTAVNEGQLLLVIDIKHEVY